MITDSFRGDCEFIFNKLKNRESFSFSKFADGEFLILVDQKLTNIDGWTFDPSMHQLSRNLLIDAFLYDDPNYFVGVSCPCCQPKPHVDWMRDTVRTKNLTWANIFVNANHDFFVENYIPEFSNWKVNLVCSANSKIENLPFELESVTYIGKQSFIDELHLIKLLEDEAKERNGELFLFCAGPLGNILAHKLHLQNPNNTYLDIGSTLNKFLLENPNRDYLSNSTNQFKNKICIW